MESRENDLRVLQALELENLKTLIQICEENNLRYFLIGGSLIGAVRHKGFIPWDDDIDVGLPRPDYNRFVAITKKYLPEYMDIKTMTSDPNYKCYYTQIINSKKKIYLERGQHWTKIGVWIDVFPIDGLPSNIVHRGFHVLCANVWKTLYKFTQIDYVSTNKERSFLECVVIKLAKVTRIGKLLSEEKMLRKLDSCLQKYDYDSSEYLWNFSGRYGTRELVPGDQLRYSGRAGEFEGLSVSIPQDAEGYLTSVYGDYMSLPPEEKRVGHVVRFADC